MSALISGRPFGILLNNTLLPIYILGFILVNYTYLYKFILNLPFIEWFLDCLIDPLNRTISLTSTIDAFKLPPYGLQPSEIIKWAGSTSYLGQWLIGIVSCTFGGLVYNCVVKNTWDINSNTLILSFVSFLYVFFSSHVYWTVFGLDIVHKEIDRKILVATIAIGFFTLRRCVAAYEVYSVNNENEINDDVFAGESEKAKVRVKEPAVETKLGRSVRRITMNKRVD